VTGRLIYCLNVSLDGYVETADHDLGWSDVDEEVHTWFNDRARQLDASLYGRRLYELMAGAAWPTIAEDGSAPAYMRDFGQVWVKTPRFVFSRSLDQVEHNSTLVRGGVREELGRIRERFDGDLEVGGATLAASFIREGLVDEFQLMVHPVVLGGGTPFFPRLEQPLRLRQVGMRTFESGVVLLTYRPA
jgi:dihydrofolate reductase